MSQCTCTFPCGGTEEGCPSNPRYVEQPKFKLRHLPPQARTILYPRNLKPRCWYQVQVSFGPGNPIHHALLYTGFLNGKNNEPGGYHMLVNHAWDDNHTYRVNEVHYLEVLKELGELT